MLPPIMNSQKHNNQILKIKSELYDSSYFPVTVWQCPHPNRYELFDNCFKGQLRNQFPLGDGGTGL